MIYMNFYGYIHMNETKELIGWRCVKRSQPCKAVIYTFKSTGLFSHWNGKFHCHSIDLRDSRKREIVLKIKNRVLDEFIPIKAIVEEEYRKANLSVEEKRIMLLPAKIGKLILSLLMNISLSSIMSHDLESGLQKLRRKALPPIPNDQKFIIPDDYQRTYDNGQFLLYDKRRSSYGGRLLIFAPEEQLKVLLQSDVLFADGTFKVSPKLFEQLYVIHGLQHEEGISIFLFLLQLTVSSMQSAVSICI